MAEPSVASHLFRIILRMSLDEQKEILEERMSVSGEIAWASEEGIGVKFNPSESLQERRVETLLI